MDRRRRRKAIVLTTVALALGLGACAQPEGLSGAPAGARTGGKAPDDRAAAGRGTLPAPIGRGCDPSPEPPRRAAIVAYDPAGLVRWSVPIPLGQDQDSSNIGPLVDGDVVVSTEGGGLRALRAADGGELWRRPLGGFVYDASIADGVLVARVAPLDGGYLVGVEAASGAELWRYAQPGQANMSWQELATDDGGVVVTDDRGGLVVLDRRHGSVRWSRQPRDRSMPRVFATAGNRVLWRNRGALEALDAGSGRLLWSVAASRPGDVSARLTVTGGVVVVTADVRPAARPVAAYDLATGHRRWRLDTLEDGSVLGAGPAGIALTAENGKARWRELALVDAATGAVRWRQPLTGYVRDDMVNELDRQVLVTAGEVVAVEEFSNLVVSRDAATGAIRWRKPLGALPGTPSWTDDGRLLLTVARDAPAASGEPARPTLDESLVSIAIGGGELGWRSRLPLLAERPATPLGQGAVIQVGDPRRICLLDAGAASADAGTATADAGTGTR
jgi:outer membrane protein assembly factor BamB